MRNRNLLSLVATTALLCGLLAHSLFYWFVCDDAFISFRYARNLVEGQGLVFNPGEVPVEGYTNFLWVLLAAAGMALGLAPELLAPGLSLLATAALFGLVARTAWKERDPAEPPLFFLAAPLLLAVTRSFAVWASSGLETRLFELLIAGGVLRLRGELAREASRPGRAAAPLPLSALLFAAACWTRPDGVLVAAACLLAALWLAGPARRGEVVTGAAVWASGVGLQLGFRLIYYRDFLPNPFYAKVGGRLWPEMGLHYLLAFGLEYSLWLWLPLALAGARRRWRAGDRATPLLCAAATLPHAAYVIAIGGDHFEYRPLDLCFPFLYLLVADGLRALWQRGAAARRATAAAAIAGLGLLVELPFRTHLNFSTTYTPGFPGGSHADASHYLRSRDGWLTSLPGPRQLTEALRAELVRITSHFVGIRAEEHRLFAADAHQEGRALARLVAAGRLPADTHIATDSVGAIPWDSRLPTLDRLGLTDRVVARSAFVRPELSGHGKTASLGYARAMGVDLWAIDPVHLIWLPFDPSLPELLGAWRDAGRDVHFAAIGSGLYLVAHLPQGIEAARQRFPKLRWRSVFDAEASREILVH